MGAWSIRLIAQKPLAQTPQSLCVIVKNIVAVRVCTVQCAHAQLQNSEGVHACVLQSICTCVVCKCVCVLTCIPKPLADKAFPWCGL